MALLDWVFSAKVWRIFVLFDGSAALQHCQGGVPQVITVTHSRFSCICGLNYP
jgi:hypothetical protein